MSELKFKTEKDLEKWIDGKYVKFKQNLTGTGKLSGVGVNSEMYKVTGRILRVQKADFGGEYCIFELVENFLSDRFVYDLSMIDEIYVDVAPIENETINIKKGDLVKIISQTASKKIGEYQGIKIFESYNGISITTGNEDLICLAVNEDIAQVWCPKTNSLDKISIKFLEIIEENYIENLKVRKVKKQNEKDILEKIEIIEEMKNKVDVKTFRKIYGGSVGVIPKNLKGVEILLNEWAFKKEKIYKLLGKQLSIQKEMQFKKGEVEIGADLEQMYYEFPRLL